MKASPIITVLFSLLMLAACKKQKQDMQYYFTFAIGSKTYSLDSATIHISTYNNTSSSFEILGYTASRSYRLNAFGINPFDTTVIGTYLTTMSPDLKKLLTGGGFIGDNPTDINFGIYPVHYDGKYSFTISEQTDIYIAGTFSGRLTADNSLKYADISNGKFRMPINK